MSNPAADTALSLNEDELAFFKAQTKIDDEDELRNHISAVQAKAYSIYPYRCIATFMFTKYAPTDDSYSIAYLSG
jgi:hypothetical protein